MLKEKKYMSSKEIYFLPIIHRFNPNELKKLQRIDSPSKILKSIEKIIHDKSHAEPQDQNRSLNLQPPTKAKSTENMYNKYELLPKILAKKYKNSKRKGGQQSSLQRHSIEHSNTIDPVIEPKEAKEAKETKGLKQPKELKENLINFEAGVYQQHFQQELQKQVSCMPFKLSHQYSQHSMLGSEGDELLDPSAELAKKYTRLATDSNQTDRSLSQLEKVPSFLLKILLSKTQNV